MPRRYRSIVVLTGAGISAESGLKTFRASDGWWENHRIEEVASPQGFAANPELVHRFYNLRRRQLVNGDVHPNPAHRALADLEVSFKGSLLLVTQNIDDLHERAGSTNLIHMHGELLVKRCVGCHAISPIREDLSVDSVCDQCGRTRVMRPHVVWFGEMPLRLDEIYATLHNCDLFVAIGTSGSVYPAAGFVELANTAGAHTVELNLQPSATQSAFAESLYGPAASVVPRFFDRVVNDC